MFCSNCGSQASGGAFCVSCGAKLPGPSAVAATSARLVASDAASSWENAQPLVPGQQVLDYPQVGNLDNTSEHSSIFHLLSKLASLLFSVGILMWLLLPLMDFGISFSESLDFVSEDPLWLPEAALAVINLVPVILRVQTWVRYLVIGLSGLLYWGILFPLNSSNDYVFRSPIELIVEYWNWWSGEGDRYWLVAVAWVLALLAMQAAPILGTIAFLGATVKNKKLS